MNLAQYIDYTDLQTTCTKKSITNLCKTAEKHGFASVCVLPYWVGLVSTILEEKRTKVGTVIGYPYGHTATAAKVEEIKRAIDEGVDELEVVVNICSIKDANWLHLQNDIDSLTRAVHMKGKVIKVTFTPHLLTDTEFNKIIEICSKVKPDFVKILLNDKSSALEQVVALKKVIDSGIKIKICGNFDSAEEVSALIEAGVRRIGSTNV